MVDVRVTPLDGKAHSVAPSDLAFPAASAVALRKTAAAMTVTLLEPIDEISVLISDDVVDAAMGRTNANDSIHIRRRVIHPL